MIGAVVHQELLLGSRRNRLHVFRWVSAGWLILIIFYFYVRFSSEQFEYSLQRRPRAVALPEVSACTAVGSRFAEAFVLQQLLLLLLATPAFVAGAITDE